MQPETLALFLAGALIAEILGTIGGFGSSLFFVPIAGYFLDFQSVLGITAIFHLSSNISKIAVFRQGIDMKLALRMGIPAVALVILGAYLTRFADPHILEVVLSVFLVLLSLFLLWFRNIIIRPNQINSVIGGGLSGFLAGLIGTGGAARGLFLAAFGLPASVFIATSAIIDLGVDFSRSVVYFLNGYVHRDDLYLVPLLLVVSIAGTFTGKYLLKFISQTRFKTIVLLLVMLTGVVSLLKYILEIV